MQRGDLKEKMLVWWNCGSGEKLLCRVVTVSESFIGIRVVAATAQQVIRTGYGAGELAYVAFTPGIFEKVSA
jgi:hypothetical protein